MHILFSHFSTADPKNTTAGGGCLNLRFSEITGTDGRSAGKRLQKKSPWARKWKSGQTQMVFTTWCCLCWLAGLGMPLDNEISD
ncbi:hypothetical protein [Klebsiella pneumoniae]|uniref:hypothetical protein n=1 Tax=Klebsiella pneumoniae TaxID=573 RepID=UPI003AE34D33